MTLIIPRGELDRIHQHGELAYPEEGAGLLLGETKGSDQRVSEILPLANTREAGARHNRYQLSPGDYLKGEEEADRLGLDLLGVFHSHPDHPNQPSDFDMEYALPWYSYIITSVLDGKAAGSRSWRLDDDRSAFDEENIVLIE